MTSTYATDPSTQPTARARKVVAPMVAAIVAGALAIGGIAAALVLALGPVRVNPWDVTSASNGGKIMVHPTAEMKMLQEKLAQLNYYDGPIDGYRNHQTVQAITYLQRDAGLPQTGRMSLASWTALTTLLVQGNNQMNP